jgi:peptidoglycan-N-acetylglucosamine deacetylase
VPTLRVFSLMSKKAVGDVSPKEKPIFFDPSKKRYPRFIFVAVIFVLCTLYVGRSLFKTVFSTPVFQHINLPEVRSLMAGGTPTAVNPPARGLMCLPVASMSLPKTLYSSAKAPRVFAFLVNWDPKSTFSLKRNVEHIDVLLPEWVHLASAEGDVYLTDRAAQVDVLGHIEKSNPDLPILVTITNYDNTKQLWDGDTVSELLISEKARDTLILALYDFVSVNGLSGININFEGIPPSHYPVFYEFLGEVNSKFSEGNFEVAVSLTVGYLGLDYTKVSESVDYVISLIYDQHWSGGPSGSPATLTWYRDNLLKISPKIPPEKFVVGLGTYGYDWAAGEGEASPITFSDVSALVTDPKKAISFSLDTFTPTFKYKDVLDKVHEVHFLDAVSFFDQVVIGETVDPHGYALWRLGAEDPSLWKLLTNDAPFDKSKAMLLEEIPSGYGVSYIGTGEVLSVDEFSKEGSREIAFDSKVGLIYDQVYNDFSTPLTVHKRGRASVKKVVLSFDDGPHPKYTLQILDILKKEDVKATFFVIGAKAQQQRRLVKRIYREGHELGNHTYTHPDISKITTKQLQVELNATQEVIKIATGHSTRLFRAPYAKDTYPDTHKELLPLKTISDLGYVSVAMELDSKDWDSKSALEIVSALSYQVDSTPGNIILLHDGGGDRSTTVSALPGIIKDLKEKGYEFVLTADLLGVSRAEILPPVKKTATVPSIINALGMTTISGTINFLRKAFLVCLAVSVARLLLIIILAIKQKLRKEPLMHNPMVRRGVSIIIPAYNEAKVIERTITAALASNYPIFEVIVVDDASQDETYKIVKEKFGDNDKVKLYTKDNGGKSTALNYGIARSKYNYFVGLDADTIIDKDALKYLMPELVQPNVGAVAGKVVVGNRKNLLTKFQTVEFITSQNLERRAYEALDCITVVPGAIGGWSKAAVLEVGGFSGQTLAEDTELTFRLLKAGYRITLADKARSYNEAPESLKNFLKQRFRWVFGTLQALRKHYDMIFNPKYKFVGLFALPFILLFQIIYAIFAPFLDLFAFLMFVNFLLTRNFHPEMATFHLSQLITFYLVFLILDIAIGILAYIMEEGEDPKLLFLIPIQRIVYRYLIYWVSLKVFYTVIKGPRVGWGKFERTATVTVG